MGESSDKDRHYLLRDIGRNYLLPLFNGEMDSHIDNKKWSVTDEESLRHAVYHVASLGGQLLIKEILVQNPYWLGKMEYLGTEQLHLLPYDAESVRNVDIEVPITEQGEALDGLMHAAWYIDNHQLRPNTDINNPPSPFAPLHGVNWTINAVDDRDAFIRKEPSFAMHVGTITDGAMGECYLYHPFKDEFFTCKEDLRDGLWVIDKFLYNKPEAKGARFKDIWICNLEPSAWRDEPSTKPLDDMTLVLMPHRAEAPLDYITTKLYQNATFDELAERFSDKFKSVIPGNGSIGHYVVELLHHNVDAICTPNTGIFEHLVPATFARLAGYSAGFLDQRAYFDEGFGLPLLLETNNSVRMRDCGGVLYTEPSVWDVVNREITEKQLEKKGCAQEVLDKWSILRPSKLNPSEWASRPPYPENMHKKGYTEYYSENGL